MQTVTRTFDRWKSNKNTKEQRLVIMRYDYIALPYGGLWSEILPYDTVAIHSSCIVYKNKAVLGREWNGEEYAHTLMARAY